MALDPRREGDRYDKLARQVADKQQTGDTQARLSKLLAERDRWYALADREDARVARWTSGLAPAQRLYGDDLDVSPAVPVPVSLFHRERPDTSAINQRKQMLFQMIGKREITRPVGRHKRHCIHGPVRNVRRLSISLISIPSRRV